MRKFTEGTFELDKDIKNLEEYEKKIENRLNDIIEWANRNDIYIRFGTSEDCTYLCEFEIIANTKQMCNGYVAELKSMLKRTFKKPLLLRQFSGDYR